MHIDFAKPDWALIQEDLAHSTLDANSRSFLKQTFDLWEDGVFQLHLSTSGSTGKPKQVTLDQDLLSWSIRSSLEGLQLNEKQNVLCCLPVHKTGGAMQIARAFRNKWAISIIDAAADPFSKIQVDHVYTTTSLTPFQLENVLNNDHSMEVLLGFDTVLIGGGLINASIRSRLRSIENRVRLVQTYGMTETAGHVALSNVNSDGLFTPLKEVKISVSEQGNAVVQILPLDLVFETNDLIEMSDTKFRIIGRSDFVINSGGLKLHPESLEERILKSNVWTPHPEFFIYGMPDTDLGQRPVLVIEGNRDVPFEELVKSCLKGAEVPRDVFYVPQFIYTESGKLDRIATSEYITRSL